MGTFTQIIKNNINTFFNRKLYFLLYLIANSFLRKKGKIRFQGLKIEYNDSTSLVGMYNEIILQECYKFIPTQNQPVIIDCGANIGISVLYFKKIIPSAKIYAIEADPAIFNILKKNITANQCDAELIEKAVWTSNDEILNFGGIGGDAGSLFANENCINVTSIRLKDFLEQFEEIELLKMDIEGAEIDVMKDCADSLSHINKVFVEYHSFTGKKQELDILLSIMTNQGFRYSILPARKERTPFINTHKNTFMDLQLNLFFYRQ